MTDDRVQNILARMINDGRVAEALGYECGQQFGPFGEDWTWDEVELWLEQHRETIEEAPDQFVLHLGMNNFRTSVFILMHRMGMLEETDRPLDKTIAWLLDGSHHTVSCYDEEWREIIATNALVTDELGLEWFRNAPHEVEIYRGYDLAEGIGKGICWSIDRDVAVQFAAGTFAKRHTDPRVLTGKVSRADLAGALFGRESQVLVTDADAIEIINEETL